MNETAMYIGPNKVKDNVVLDEKLPTGEDLIDITYESGKKELLTRRTFEAVVKNEPSDLTTLRGARIIPLVQEMLTSMLNWGVKVDEVEFAMSLLTNSINQNLKESDTRVWGKERSEITLIDMDKLLRKVTVKDVIDGSS